MNDKVIAVNGATGQQGGAVARKLLADGWKVRALTRDIDKPAAQELASLGAEIFSGDMENRAELDSAFKGAYGVFSFQNFWLPNVGFEGEIRQGKNVAAAAKAAGVNHLVFSSVGAAHRGMGQKHFESKWIIEQYIHSLDIPYTILRPAFFMENYNWSRAQILNGILTGMGLRPEKGLQSVAVEDIGVFVALAFANPEQYIGKTIELSGDELTEAQIADTFTKVIGRPVKLTMPTGDGGRRRSEEEMIAMFNFFNGEGYGADIPALRKLHPGLLTLEQYLRKNGWENAEPIPMPENSGWGR
ncbi:MAG TPA: NmrA/HSCARG family protein [Anaerolineales bacterium]